MPCTRSPSPSRRSRSSSVEHPGSSATEAESLGPNRLIAGGIQPPPPSFHRKTLRSLSRPRARSHPLKRHSPASATATPSPHKDHDHHRRTPSIARRVSADQEAPVDRAGARAPAALRQARDAPTRPGLHQRAPRRARRAAHAPRARGRRRRADRLGRAGGDRVGRRRGARHRTGRGGPRVGAPLVRARPRHQGRVRPAHRVLRAACRTCRSRSTTAGSRVSCSAA